MDHPMQLSRAVEGWGPRPAQRSRSGRRSAVLLVLAITAVLLAACARASSPPSSPNLPTSAPDLKDFNIVAYQGEGVLGGSETTFSKVFEQGKPVVLNFWAGLCPPCRAEMPAFQKVADEYEGKAIFVGVDIGVFTGLGDNEDARRLLAELNIRYPAGYAVDASPVRLYNVRGMPTTIFFNSKGQITDQVIGTVSETRLRSLVENLVAASS